MKDYKINKNNTRKPTGIEKLADQVGAQLRKEFPTQKELNSHLDQNRKKLYKRIYGSSNSLDE